MSDAWNSLAERVRELNDLASAAKLLHWDQTVMMPSGGAPVRARVLATIEALAHRRLIDPALDDLLGRVCEDDSLDEIKRASARVLRRDYDLATRVPEDLVRAVAEARGLAYQAWTEAKAAADFSLLEPHLARLVGLKKQEADALGWEEERYDALLDTFEPGLTTRRAREMFAELVPRLKPIVEGALERRPRYMEWLTADYEPGRQLALCQWLVEHIGFEGAAGRVDESPHPFTIHIGPGDVRQTLKTDSRALLFSLYAAMHETGHALYEQGLPEELLDQPVGRVPSLGIHESQSRLWENQVGRGRAFTAFLLPRLKEHFPEPLGMLSPDDFYRGVNLVQRSPIRVSADELTYNLHIAYRFELEVALFRDQLEVADAPTAWSDKMEEHLGLRPADDAEGVLQDMHWAIGALGYFPTYTIGNLYAAALYERVRVDLSDLDDQLRAGETGALLAWLRERVHSRAYIVPAGDLMTEVTGGPVGAGPLLAYLEDKYRDI